MKILVVYYSLYGHIHQLAEAAAKGINEVEETEAVLRKVPETLSKEVIEKMGAKEAQDEMKDVPVCTLDDIASADGIMFGTPTRFGNMCGQMRQFLDSTGQLWLKGALLGKPAGVFTSSASQHGGQESTILSFFNTLLHHGMIVVGLPYSFKGHQTLKEVCGCSPYGASTIAGNKNERWPSEIELEGAAFQGKHIAKIAKRLKG